MSNGRRRETQEMDPVVAGHGPRAGQARARRRRDPRGAFAVLLSLLILGGLLGGAAYGGKQLIDRLDTAPAVADFPGPGSGKVVIRVRTGQNAGDIATTLKTAGIVQSRTAFLNAAAADKNATKIQPGYYSLQKQMRASDALATIVGGNARAEKKVTVAEGLRLDETLKTLAKGTGISLVAFENALKTPAKIGLPDYAKGNPEGFLFPATYEVPPGANATQVLTMMTRRFEQAANVVGISGEDAFRTVVIASLVEAEASRDEDLGKVARVAENRLDQGMRLQFDSTVNYARDTNEVLVTLDQLKTDSPYNTYEISGLPPGPVGSPGEKALKAAKSPTPGDWLFFVTTDPKTGETKFTDSFSQHKRNKEEYKRNLAAG